MKIQLDALIGLIGRPSREIGAAYLENLDHWRNWSKSHGHGEAMVRIITPNQTLILTLDELAAIKNLLNA